MSNPPLFHLGGRAWDLYLAESQEEAWDPRVAGSRKVLVLASEIEA